MVHFKLPAPELSYLKEVDIDLDMTGRHYVKLSTSAGQLPEQVIVDILGDLMKQDPNELTMEEMRYLFMMVKINSLENNYTVTVTCTHKRLDGNECGCEQTVKVRLSDADLKRTPKNYKVPRIMFTGFDGEYSEYEVMPPKIKDEIDLMQWFANDRGITKEQIASDRELSFEFTFLRGLLHLRKDGRPLFQKTSEYGEGLKLLDANKYPDVGRLYEKMAEVDSFGIENKTQEIKCKECGGTLVFAPPLLHGLID